jgi:hypothetical protein
MRTLFPYTTLFRSLLGSRASQGRVVEYLLRAESVLSRGKDAVEGLKAARKAKAPAAKKPAVKKTAAKAKPKTVAKAKPAAKAKPKAAAKAKPAPKAKPAAKARPKAAKKAVKKTKR